MNLPSVTSPDGVHRLELSYESEIRFGPAYYCAAIDGKTIPKRIFGNAALWSPDSRFLALQEWLTTDYQDGPQTALLVFDFQDSREVKASSAHKGFISPIRFSDDTLIYKKEYFGTGKIGEYEIDLISLNRWNPSNVTTKTEQADAGNCASLVPDP